MWTRLKEITGRIALATGLAMAVALVVLVRSSDDVPEDRIVVTTWGVTGAEDVTPVIPPWFNASQDRIYVKSVGLPFLEVEQKFLTAVVGNIPPDCFEYFGSVAQWSTRGALLPLDEFMKRDNFDRSSVFPTLWEEMMWNGRTYAIPTGVGNEAFFWNKAHFREAGLDPERPPQTWTELEEYAVRLTKYAPDGSIDRAGYIPGYWSPLPNTIFLDWPLQLDAKFLSEDGTKVTLTSEGCIRALEWEGKLFERLGRDALLVKRASYGYGTQHGFLSGNLSMIAQKSSFIEELEKFAPNLEYGVAPFPIPEGGRRACVAGSVWVGIPTGARHPEEAWEYIKFLTRTDTQLRAADYAAKNNLVSFFPANIAAANSPSQQALPFMNVFVESMQWGRSSTVIPIAHPHFWRAYQEAWDAVMRGDKTPREALTIAEAEVQKALDSQLAYDRFYQKYLAEKLGPASGGADAGEGSR